MAHIVEFSVDNLAGRKGVYSRKLNRDVNIFFGLNGSGKTSLLRILNSAMVGDAGLIGTVPFKSAQVTIHSLQYGTDFKRTIARKEKANNQIELASEDTGLTRVIFEEEEEEELEWKTEPSNPDTSRVRWQHIYLPTWRLYVGNEPSVGTRIGRFHNYAEREEDWDKFFGSKLEELWSQCSNKMLSEVKLIQGEGLASIMRGILAKSPRTKKIPKKIDIEIVYKRVNAFLERQNSQNVLGPIRTFITRYVEDERIRSAVSDIDKTEQRIEKVMTARYNLEKLITAMFTGNKTVAFSDTGIDVKTDEGKGISLASMSSGEKHALWIFIEAILAGESTLIIDEPELSLHIDWQKMLVNSIRQLNPQAQLILATHSPEIIADVDDSKIFRL